MGQGYILDTNIVIYFLEGVLNESGKNFVKEALQQGGKISIISKIELLAWSPPRESQLINIMTFLSNAKIYGLNDEIADQTIQIKKTYRKIKLPDAIIAATALCLGFELISRNTSDFVFIKELVVIDPFKI